MTLAETVFTPENIGVATALIGALTASLATIIGARSKSKLDARAELEAELARVSRKLDDARDDHAENVTRYEAEIDGLNAKLAARDQTISRMDERIVALLTWVARLRRRLAEHGVDEPDRPTGVDS